MYWPDDRAYRELCIADAAYLIRRIRGHACLLMWVGNNEAYMYGESEEGGKKEFGFQTFMLDFARLCEEMDPEQFYTPSSPFGGKDANDALEGDTHAYSGAYHVAGLQYPVFFSEDCYTTALPLHSMRRFMSEEEIYPKDYVNCLPYGAKNPAYAVNRHKYEFAIGEIFRFRKHGTAIWTNMRSVNIGESNDTMMQQMQSPWCIGPQSVRQTILKAQWNGCGAVFLRKTVQGSAGHRAI